MGHFANVAPEFKSLKVEHTTVHVESGVLLLEPDLVVPVYASVVHPLLGLQVYHSPLQVRTEEAVREDYSLLSGV